jgi:hypothetical protein
VGIGQGAKEQVDGDLRSARAARFGDIQIAVHHAQIVARRDHVDVVGLQLQAFAHLHDRHSRDLSEDGVRGAFVPGREVQHHDESHARIRGQVFEEATHRHQTAGGSANADDGERHAAHRVVRALGRRVRGSGLIDHETPARSGTGGRAELEVYPWPARQAARLRFQLPNFGATQAPNKGRARLALDACRAAASAGRRQLQTGANLSPCDVQAGPAMPRIIHVLPAARQRRTWIVRTDGVADVTLGCQEQAMAYARTVALRLACRLSKPVLLRAWTWRGDFTEEEFKPELAPRDQLGMRRVA